MSWKSDIILAISIVFMSLSTVRAQSSATGDATVHATIVVDDGSSRIFIRHSPFFGSEQLRPASSAGSTPGGALMITRITGDHVTIRAKGESGYEVNVSVSLSGDLESPDGLPAKIRGDVSYAGPDEITRTKWSSIQRHSHEEMRFRVLAMPPERVPAKGGQYTGSFNVIMTYN
ncbi:MAG: hypothetical protein Q8916_09500 [Bacteroidota bacterium]|nr:hypothetical protein [Bacteroidota bacterium]MDP4230623.1 hypothetical protein [Bacteroidota bacterium]MDP4235477.1 hypothetical protein [Bacteroidota bacterium]